MRARRRRAIDSSVPGRDLEYLAFRAGLKPAVRLTVSGADLAAAGAHYLAVGGHLAFVELPEERGGNPRRPSPRVFRERTARGGALFVAHSPQEAQALAELERKLIRRGPHPKPSVHAEEAIAIGRGLGYPDCCVEAFAERLRGAPSRRFRGSLGCRLRRRPTENSDDYVVARENWTPRADARLNHLLFRAGVKLLSYTPCRYDCPAALAQADLLLAELDRVEPGAGAGLLQQLAVTVVAAADHARAIVELEGDRIVEAHGPEHPEGSLAPVEGDVALAQSCVGARVLADGTVERGKRERFPPVALRFVAPGP